MPSLRLNRSGCPLSQVEDPDGAAAGSHVHPPPPPASVCAPHPRSRVGGWRRCGDLLGQGITQDDLPGKTHAGGVPVPEGPLSLGTQGDSTRGCAPKRRNAGTQPDTRTRTFPAAGEQRRWPLAESSGPSPGEWVPVQRRLTWGLSRETQPCCAPPQACGRLQSGSVLFPSLKLHKRPLAIVPEPARPDLQLCWSSRKGRGGDLRCLRATGPPTLFFSLCWEDNARCRRGGPSALWRGSLGLPGGQEAGRSAATSPELRGEGSTSRDGRQGRKGPGPPRAMGRWHLTWPDSLAQGRHPPQGPGTQHRVW